jgi:hypothetical protein
MLVKDLSGNGAGVEVSSSMSKVDFSTGNKVVPHGSRYLRAQGAGNITFRPAGSDVDVVLPVTDGEYVPIAGGSTIKQAGTTVTGLVATESH